MTRNLILAMVLVLVGSGSNAAPSKEFEGQWENPQRTTLVNVSVCGEGPQYCAVVLKALSKAFTIAGTSAPATGTVA